MDSKFTGGVFAYCFYRIAVWLVCLITLGFCYPFIVCGYWRWKASHTYISGLKIKFTGKALALFKKYIVWWALSIITLGIYGVSKLDYDIKNWEIENTHIDGREGQKSYFNAKWYQLCVIKTFCVLMTILSLGIGYAWAHCAYREWLCWHTYLDGNSFDYKGEGKEYLKKYVLWCLLSEITLGIYGFWFAANIMRWETARTDFKFKEYVAEGKTVYLIRPTPVQPKPVDSVSKPVMGEHFKRVYEFMMVKRAMICFTCEIPFIICVTLIMAFTIGFYVTCILAPLLLWFVVLLSLPAIFIVEERFKDIGGIRLQSAMAWSITGLIFSLAVPVFLPVFIYGLVETVRLKKWIYGNDKITEDSTLTQNGEAIIPEQELYFNMSKQYQIYIWDCSNYKKAVKSYAKSVIDYNDKLKAYNDALKKSGT